MRRKDYQTTKAIGIDHKTRDLMKLFLGYMDTDINELTNKLYRQWFFNSLETLEYLHPDRHEDWKQIRQLLHN
jgi:hypothetical protein